MPTCQCATLYRRNICTLLLGGPAHPRLPLFFQPLSHSVPFGPILSHSLFHPVPSSHSPRLRLLSTFPWTIWHAPVPPLPIQTSTRSLQSYSSLRRACESSASTYRRFTASQTLSLSHCLSLAASRKRLRRLRTHARKFYHVLLCPCARPGEPSLLQRTPFAGAIHQGERENAYYLIVVPRPSSSGTIVGFIAPTRAQGGDLAWACPRARGSSLSLSNLFSSINLHVRPVRKTSVHRRKDLL